MNPSYEIILKFNTLFIAKNLDEYGEYKYFIGKQLELGVYKVIKWFWKA